jgi:predicted nucleic acid-binding protein
VRFADTSFWVALLLRRDRHHHDARALWVAREGLAVVTNHVLGEVWTFLRRRDSHELARRAVRDIRQSPSVEVVAVAEDLEAEAWRWLDCHDERPYSFVDATSFAVMRARRIHEVYAFDGDFAAAGFVEVRP